MILLSLSPGRIHLRFVSHPSRTLQATQSLHTTSLCRTSRSPRKNLRPIPRKEFEERVVKMTEKHKLYHERYGHWERSTLIERIMQLEKELLNRNKIIEGNDDASAKKVAASRVFDKSRYSTRFIALKLAYLGKRYTGFEYHANNNTRATTIEEELWKALNKARLIFPDSVTDPLEPGIPNFNGCDYAKCGRTDKGVSSFGQVISLTVRSNRPLPKPKREQVAGEEADSEMEEQPEKPFDDIQDEIQYVEILNKLLPKDIRILAWCPNPPPGFSARFSCKERQYRYFFTQPVFTPIPNHLEHQSGKTPAVKPGWLDIEKMREAAKLFEGTHDFRNFCKIDGARQLTNFVREVYKADIEPVKDQTGVLASFSDPSLAPSTDLGSPDQVPTVWTFTLHGSAFLWHQVRHMVAILFAVGQGLEEPSIVSKLMDVEKEPRKPVYTMASDVPLVLWDCVFPEGDPERKDAVQWIYCGDLEGQAGHKFGPMSLMEDVWSLWREQKIDEILAAGLLGVVASQGKPYDQLTGSLKNKNPKSHRTFEGANKSVTHGAYVPILQRARVETPEELNEKYAIRKGFAGSADMREKGFRFMKNQAAAAAEALGAADGAVQEMINEKDINKTKDETAST